MSATPSPTVPLDPHDYYANPIGPLDFPNNEDLVSTPIATTYNLSGPVSVPIGTPATFTVALPQGEALVDPVIIMPHDGGAGGTFSPIAVALGVNVTSATFTYTPSVYGDINISVSSSGALTDPAPAVLVSTADSYLFSGPTGGIVGIPSTDFTVELPAGGVVMGSVHVTPNDGAGGGSFAPAGVVLTTAAPSAVFTYTPVLPIGNRNIAVTNDGGLSDPASLSYNVRSVVNLLNTLISYWKLDEASGTRNDSQGTNNLTAVNAPGSAAGKINSGASFVSASSQGLDIANNSTLQVTGDFTFSLWVKLTSQPSVTYILAKVGTPGGTDYSLVYDPSGQGYEVGVGNVAVVSDFAVQGSTTANGVWTHIVFWFDASGDSQVHLRINDANTYVSTTSPPLVQTASPLFIGGGNTLFSSSVVDEVGFWKRKLNAPEITALYNGGAGLPFSSFT